MCGITGVLSVKKNWQTKSILYHSIKELLNRGYDSLGVSFVLEKEFKLKRSVEKEEVFSFLREEEQDVQNAIAHTRWATHGDVTVINAHPHIDTLSGSLSLVHNGIIENFQQHKTRLMKKNIPFASSTDSEVIVNLIAEAFQEQFLFMEDPIERLCHSLMYVTKQLEGTYGIIVQHKDFPQYLFCARKGSPLLIGTNEDKSLGMVVSEKSGFLDIVQEYVSLVDNSLYILENTGTQILYRSFEDKDQGLIYQVQKIANEDEYLKTDHGFRCLTEKEIWEQPVTIQQVTHNGSRIHTEGIKLGGLDSVAGRLRKCRQVFLFGCGTSYHTALIGATYLRQCTCLDLVQVFDASEFSIADLPRKTSQIPGNEDKSCCIFISQSGETLDLYAVLQQVKGPDVLTLGIINVVDSLIARTVDAGVYMNCGRERGVASSKSFTASVLICWMISQWFEPRNLSFYKKEMTCFPSHLSTSMEQMRATVQAWARDCVPQSSFFILGKGIDFFIAKEASLKIKELSYIHAEGFSSSALKHGPFALLHKSGILFFIVTQNQWYQKSLNALNEVLARKINVYLVCTQTFRDLLPIIPNHLEVFILGESPWTYLIGNVFFQFLALEIAFLKGHDPDFPRNLAKVVTVE